MDRRFLCTICTPTECFERNWAHLRYSPFNDLTYKRALKGKLERQNFGNKRISLEQSTPLRVTARRVIPTMNFNRDHIFDSRPNNAVPRNENSRASSAVR